jgi:hypothetical protein
MQTTNIIHFPGLPLFRLEYKFTKFILVPGPSSRWRWHHRHLAGPARSGRPGRSVSVRSVSVRSGPGGGLVHTQAGPETIAHLGVCCVPRVVKVACSLDSRFEPEKLKFSLLDLFHGCFSR